MSLEGRKTKGLKTYFVFLNISMSRSHSFLFGSMSSILFKITDNSYSVPVYRIRTEVSMHTWNFEEMNIIPHSKGQEI